LVDFVQHWSQRTEIGYEQLLRWIQLSSRKFRDWRSRYGKANEHNHLVPRDHWLEDWEKEAIVKFFGEYPLEGYRRLCFMMLDRDLVAVSPASVYRVADAELVLQRGREKFPHARPQIISDNGPQFVAKDFKEFLRLWQTTHVRTSPHYPQSNGKLERYHRTLKEQAIRPKTPLTLEDARRVVGEFVEHYNTVRLHSALGYVTPRDRLEGRHQEIYAARDRKLEAARHARRQRRAQPEFSL
jgi:transposase InsO family protein